MILHLPGLAGACDVKQANGLVRTAEGKVLAIRRKRGSKKGVRAHLDRPQQFPAFRIPQLDFSESSWRASNRCENLSVRGKNDRVYALRAAHQPSCDAGAVGAMENDLVVPGDSENLPVGRVSKGRYDGGCLINRGLDRDGIRVQSCRGVVLTAFDNPFAEQVYLLGRERSHPHRHAGLDLAREVFEKQALFRLSGNERCSVTSAFFEIRVGGHQEAAASHRGQVASLALRGQNWKNVPRKTDFPLLPIGEGGKPEICDEQIKKDDTEQRAGHEEPFLNQRGA